MSVDYNACVSFVSSSETACDYEHVTFTGIPRITENSWILRILRILVVTHTCTYVHVQSVLLFNANFWRVIERGVSISEFLEDLYS